MPAPSRTQRRFDRLFRVTGWLLLVWLVIVAATLYGALVAIPLSGERRSVALWSIVGVTLAGALAFGLLGYLIAALEHRDPPSTQEDG